MNRTVLGLFQVPREGPGNLSHGVPHGYYSYRADLLHGDGIDLIRVNPAVGRAHIKARDVVEHRTGYATDLTVRSLAAARRADVVLAFLEGEARLAALFRRHRVPPYDRTPLVVISCWWAEELVSGDVKTREQILRDVQGIDRLIVFSRNQRDVFEALGVPRGKVVPISFGVDQDFYRPGDANGAGPQVLAAGVDRGRDWETLVGAARLLPDVSFTIMTRPETVPSTPPNVTVIEPVDIFSYQRILASALLVVVPTHNLAYPTGQSVLLEACASQICTLVTRTPAMNDYFRDGETALGIPLGDPAGVAQVIARALDDGALRRTVARRARAIVETEFSFRTMWNSVREILCSV